MENQETTLGTLYTGLTGFLGRIVQSINPSNFWTKEKSDEDGIVRTSEAAEELEEVVEKKRKTPARKNKSIRFANVKEGSDDDEYKPDPDTSDEQLDEDYVETPKKTASQRKRKAVTTTEKKKTKKKSKKAE